MTLDLPLRPEYFCESLDILLRQKPPTSNYPKHVLCWKKTGLLNKIAAFYEFRTKSRNNKNQITTTYYCIGLSNVKDSLTRFLLRENAPPQNAKTKKRRTKAGRRELRMTDCVSSKCVVGTVWPIYRCLRKVILCVVCVDLPACFYTTIHTLRHSILRSFTG